MTGENLCGESERAFCREQHGDFLYWACAECEKVIPGEASGRALNIQFLRNLQCGGYPFEANELTLEDWMDLGLAAQIEDKARLKSELSPWLLES